MNGGANNPNEHNVDIRPDKILTVPQSTQCKIVGFPKDTGNTKTTLCSIALLHESGLAGVLTVHALPLHAKS
jgi:hypothetical protein